MGDAAVGKTSLRKNFMGESFKNSYAITIGAEFSVYKIQDYTLHIWDLAGQIRFESVLQGYYKGTLGALVVFDISNRKSFDNLPHWINGLENNNGLVPLIIVGNKSDLREHSNSEVTKEEAEAYAKTISEWGNVETRYVETSALLGENVDFAFQTLIEAVDRII